MVLNMKLIINRHSHGLNQTRRSHFVGQLIRRVSMIFLSFFLSLSLSSNLFAQSAPYSAGGWSTLHADGANRKQVNRVNLADQYEVTHVLKGSSVLTAPTLSPDGSQFYVSTGQGAGASNLHAFNLAGELQWKSGVVDFSESGEAAGVDGCAILSSPIVAADGDVYISDCDQVWAYSPNGEVKWVVDQPEPPAEAWQPESGRKVNSFTTAVMTNDGDLMGLTNYGDVRIIDTETGKQISQPLRLAGIQPALSSRPLPDAMLASGLMDPELRVWAWQLLMGGAMPSANTPAIDHRTGRIFVAVSSVNEGLGALVALDIEALKGRPVVAGQRVTVTVAWSVDMGPGSGSSPALSPDAKQIYVSDEAGMFYGVNTATGDIQWQLETASAAASPAVGADGTIYSLQQYAPAIIAINPDGSRKWESDVSEFANKALPDSFFFGDAKGVGNGNPTILDDALLVPIVYGYRFKLGSRLVPFSLRSTVVALDLNTGKAAREVVTIPDDSSGITAVFPNGYILNSLGAAITSSVSPMAGIANFLLPGKLTLLEGTGGLSIAKPIK